MLNSMTGFGTASLENEQFRVSVELKSLNSKFLDANVRLPKLFSDKEIEVRNLLSEKLERGKINLMVDFQSVSDNEPKVFVNRALVEIYYKDLEETAKQLGANTTDLFRIAVQMPQAIDNKPDTGDHDEEWKMLSSVLNTAIEKCLAFRQQEGKLLMGKILTNIDVIDQCLTDVEARDPERVEFIKTRVRNRVEEQLKAHEVDKNRFEQELIYYIEKLDINEEKVRLKAHLDYFREVAKDQNANGKKLNFISQEIGREINTMGAKANDAVIQRTVVQMKEELEKIKEQLMNIL